MQQASLARQVDRVGKRRGLRELALIAAVYLAYELSRVAVQGRRSSAFGNASRVLHVERISGIAWERTVNSVVSAHRVVAVSADYMYATLHYLVTPLVLVWLWRRHGAVYSRARSTLMLATVLGLVTITLLPVAPPRLLPGFVDTMARYAQFGWWDTDASAPRGVEGFTNEIAAMPSLHVGWALWCGWQLARHAERRLVRVLGALYPVATSLVVIGTGNHYVLDVVGGVTVVAVAAAMTMTVSWLRRPRVIDLTAPAPALAPAAPTLPRQPDRPRSRAGPDDEATIDMTATESVVTPVTPRASR